MMSPDEEEIVVELTDDEEQQSDQGTTKVAPESEAVAAVQKSVEDYEATLNAEREAKLAAEARALEAEKKASEAQVQARSSENATVEAALAIAANEHNEAKRALKEAMEKGDFEGVVEANAKLAESSIKISKLKDIKIAVERTPTRQTSADPVEDYISRFTPRSQDYLRRNKEYITDPAKNKLLVAAHYKAEAHGLKPDTDSYFEFLDAEMKPTAPKAPAPAPKSVPAAPVSRGNDITSGGSGGTRQVKLTPRQAAAATDGTIVWNHGPNKGKPIGIKEYARRLESMGNDDSEMAS